MLIRQSKVLSTSCNRLTQFYPRIADANSYIIRLILTCEIVSKSSSGSRLGSHSASHMPYSCSEHVPDTTKSSGSLGQPIYNNSHLFINARRGVSLCGVYSSIIILSGLFQFSRSSQSKFCFILKKNHNINIITHIHILIICTPK